MGPTPISLVDNMHSDALMRERWNGNNGDLDPKAVGGHLLLGKRNSTPIHMGPFSQMKIHQPTLPKVSQLPQLVSTVGSLPLASEGSSLHHRRLDRTQSEPIRTQVQPSAIIGADGRAGPATSSSRYKTELCRPFGETGFCKYGEKCQFAHGSPELRNMPRHPKYKTELCRTFHTTGLCGYGIRCHFIHNADERRSPSESDSAYSMMSQDEINAVVHTPPSSIHGSPTSQVGTFFDENFSMGSHGSDDLMTFNYISMETPPETPVESLAGDMDNLSLSPDLSNSPPPSHNPFGSLGSILSASGSPPTTYRELLERAQYLRLPIFETLTTEVQ